MRRILELFVLCGIFFCGAATSEALLIRTASAQVPVYECPVETGGTMTLQELVEKYADDESKFGTLVGKDGVRVHDKDQDQGNGPDILLIHSSSGDVRDWESFVAMGHYESGNPERMLGHVRAPSPVFWGGGNAKLSLETA